MRIKVTDTFAREVANLVRHDRHIVTPILEALLLLATQPEHPSLGFKKVQSLQDHYEARVNRSIRIVMRKQGEFAYLVAIGHHDILP